MKAIGQEHCLDGRSVTIHNGDTIITYVEKPPYLKDGYESYMKWIKNNVDQNLMADGNAEKKQVLINFMVHEDGSTSDFKILKSVGDPYDREALRVIKENPGQWVAGQCGNKKIKTRTTMAVKF